MVHTNSKGLIFSAVFSLSFVGGSIQASDLKRQVAFYAGASALASTTESLLRLAVKGKGSEKGFPIAGFDFGRVVPVTAQRQILKDNEEGKNDTFIGNAVRTSERRYDVRAGYVSVGISVPEQGSLFDRVWNAHPHIEGISIINITKTAVAAYAITALAPVVGARFAPRK
jgi:hypothetical protein